MAIQATNKIVARELIPEGAYSARIYQIIHIGTVAGFQGKLQNKARITFELPTETKVFDQAKGEQPQVLSQEFTLSFHEKATLRKVIDACDPKSIKVDDDGFVDEYDIENLLGKVCLVTVKHDKKKDGSGDYQYIDNYTVLPKGMSCPEAVNPPKVLNYTNFDRDFFMTLPDFIKDKITSSHEYKSLFDKQEDIDINEVVY